MLDIKFENFFDRAMVVEKIKSGTRRKLSKIGAYVRTSAKTSIRSRQGVAQPGSPPSNHSDLLKKFLFFAWNPEDESVVVGPQLLPSKQRGSTATPDLLEHGGTGVGPNGKPALYRAFPFMQPALETNLSKFPEMFEGLFDESGALDDS